MPLTTQPRCSSCGSRQLVDDDDPLCLPCWAQVSGYEQFCLDRHAAADRQGVDCFCPLWRPVCDGTFAPDFSLTETGDPSHE